MKSKFKRLVSFLQICIFVWLSFYIHAEEEITSLNSTIIPPSPQSAKYQTYMASRPTLATGAVNVSIPLYQIQYGGISIPFSLTYRSNGIKVEDDPYPCGYGWSFMPGLRVSRTIMGRPDEQYAWSEPQSSTNIPFDTLKSYIKDDPQFSADKTLKDTQYDIFTAILPSGTVRFLLHHENGALKVMTLDTEWRIEVNMSADNTYIAGFKFWDESGNTYYFSDFYERIGTLRYVTSWMLQSIQFANGKKISFDWVDYSHGNYTWHQFAPYTIRDCQNFTSSQSEISFPDSTNTSQTGDLVYYGKHNRMQHLKSVEFPGGNIEIVYDAKASSGMPLIRQFIVKNSAGQTIKNVSLEYGETDENRFLLKKINISGDGVYSFSYNELQFSAATLYAQDYWGFYNGKIMNRSLIPYINLRIYESQFDNVGTYKYFGNADRSVDETNMKANILTRVTYPTGGYSEFEYEMHRFENAVTADTYNIANERPLSEGGGLRVSRIIDCAGGPDDMPIERIYEYGKNGNGLGKSIAEPVLSTFVQTYRSYDFVREYSYGMDDQPVGYYDYYPTYRVVTLNPTSNYLRYAINCEPIWYEEVAEYTDAGKTVYTFVNPTVYERSGEFGKEDLIGLFSLFSDGVKIASVQYYKVVGNGYELVGKKNYTYGSKSLPMLYATFVRREIYSHVPGCTDNPDFNFRPAGGVQSTATSSGIVEFPYEKDDIYFYHTYNVRLQTEFLQKVTEQTFASSVSQEVETLYEYTDNNQLRNKIVRVNGEMMLTENYKYPFDSVSSPVFQAMTDLNILDEPYRIVRTEKGQSQIKESSFAKFGNLYLPKNVITKQGDGIGQSIEYGYDNYGNIVSAKFNGNYAESYLWGYDGLYPVLHAAGVDYDRLQRETGYIATLSGLTGASLVERCERIRSLMQGKALVSTFTYVPLVGPATSTSPNGLTTTFQYDNVWRLSEVYDHEGNILSRYAYQLAGDRLSAALSVETNQIVGKPFRASVIQQESSGDVSVEWQTQSEALSFLSATGLTADILVSRPGSYPLVATVTDKMTGASVDIRKIIVVQPECIELIPESEEILPTSFAQITATNPVVLKFVCRSDLHSTSSTMGAGTVCIDGTSYTIVSDGESVREISYSMNPGTISVSVSVLSDSTGTITLELAGVEGTYGETVKLTSIQARR